MALHRSRRNRYARVLADLLLLVGAIIALGVLIWLASSIRAS